MNKFVANTVKGGMAALALLTAAGCQNTKALDEVRAIAERADQNATAAQTSANTANSNATAAKSAADAAQSTANQALQAAQAAQAGVDALNEKVDRMFQKSVSK